MSRNKSNPLADKRKTGTRVKKRGYTECQKYEEEWH